MVSDEEICCACGHILDVDFSHYSESTGAPVYAVSCGCPVKAIPAGKGDLKYGSAPKGCFGTLGDLFKKT